MKYGRPISGYLYQPLHSGKAIFSNMVEQDLTAVKVRETKEPNVATMNTESVFMDSFTAG